jgi:hypothetical protein
MDIQKYNAEGYPDPTAYKAIKNVLNERPQRKDKRPYMPKVFICSPYAGDIESNIKKARLYCKFAVDNNYIPFAPHLLFPQFLDDTVSAERELGIFMGTVYMDDCREIWVFGDRITNGMNKEICRAKRRGLVIRHFTEAFVEVFPK